MDPPSADDEDYVDHLRRRLRRDVSLDVLSAVAREAPEHTHAFLRNIRYNHVPMCCDARVWSVVLAYSVHTRTEHTRVPQLAVEHARDAELKRQLYHIVHTHACLWHVVSPDEYDLAARFILSKYI